MGVHEVLGITAEQVKQRRADTGRGMMDCKRDLVGIALRDKLLAYAANRDPELLAIVLMAVVDEVYPQ